MSKSYYVQDIKSGKLFGPIQNEEHDRYIHPQGFAYKSRQGITWKLVSLKDEISIQDSVNDVVDDVVDVFENLSTEDIVTSQRQQSVNASWYDYPFSTIKNEFGYLDKFSTSSIYTQIIGQPDNSRHIVNFPDNIKTYIWGREGENDEQSWLLLCQLDNGYYAYLEAWCDYTGFDCQGGMKLYCSKELHILLEMAMDDTARQYYYSDLQ
jgi:hypothetical protein